jgi:hypothetical protein
MPGSIQGIYTNEKQHNRQDSQCYPLRVEASCPSCSLFIASTTAWLRIDITVINIQLILKPAIQQFLVF